MRFKIGENGRVLRERGEKAAQDMFGLPLADLSRRQLAELLAHLKPDQERR